MLNTPLWSSFSPQERAEILQGVPEDEAHVMKFRNWWLEKLVDKWLDFYFHKQEAFTDKRIYRGFLMEQINFYADYLQRSINRVKTFTIERFDVVSFERAQEIDATYQELIYDGESIPETSINYRKNKEELAKKWPWCHNLRKKMEYWWFHLVKGSH